MKIEYVHASKFGNGATVAAEFRRLMAAHGIDVDIHDVREVSPKTLAPADLYVFSSPGRMGRPIRSMRRFLKKVDLPVGTRYALVSTEMAPRPDKKTGALPTAQERAKHQRIIPIMNQLLTRDGLVDIADTTILVEAMRGPLEPAWTDKVEELVAKVISTTIATVDPVPHHERMVGDPAACATTKMGNAAARTNSTEVDPSSADVSVDVWC